MGPSASDSAFSFTHSGSLPNLAQLSLAASRLLCRSIYTSVRPFNGSSSGVQYPTPCIPSRSKIFVSCSRKRFSRLQLAFVGVIDAQLIYHARIVAHGLCRKPARRRQHHRRPNSLQYVPSIHSISSVLSALSALTPQ